jgi:hypothetical protein
MESMITENQHTAEVTASLQSAPVEIEETSTAELSEDEVTDEVEEVSDETSEGASDEETEEDIEEGVDETEEHGEEQA